ncbi:uncharacterized protein [Zea mays]|uniref:uncharacterized protein n=1 Tax=Zea mays TaxID=4577 RepID=UPI001651FF32|nr:uncharacterized protein LOC118477069 [Zea mays]
MILWWFDAYERGVHDVILATAQYMHQMSPPRRGGGSHDYDACLCGVELLVIFFILNLSSTLSLLSPFSLTSLSHVSLSLGLAPGRRSCRRGILRPRSPPPAPPWPRAPPLPSPPLAATAHRSPKPTFDAPDADLTGGSKQAATTTPFYLALDHRASATSSPPPAEAPPLPCAANSERGSEIIKAKIMSHPLYPAVLRAFIDCRKVRVPPEIVGRLSALADDVEMNSDDIQEQRRAADPELDQFMEIYYHMLVRYRQELTRPIEEADEFFRSMEAQIDAFSLLGRTSLIVIRGARPCVASNDVTQQIHQVCKFIIIYLLLTIL